MKLINKLYFSIITGLVLVACNKSSDTSLAAPENEDNVSRAGNKVLMDIVDGLVGTEVKSVAPANISAYTSSAVFSYDAINSYNNNNVTNAYGWSNILTGVDAPKHKVAGDFSTANFTDYPSVFTRLKTLRGSLSTVAIATNSTLHDNLLSDAGEKFVFANNDLQAFTKSTEVLQNQNPDLSVVQFGGVDSAGSVSAYSASNTIYKQAINRIDAYIGALTQTIKNRANYNKEEWLIIVASGKGSNTRYVPTGSDTWNAFDDKMHNTFMMFYNPRFIPAQYSRPTGIIPYQGNTPVYTVSGSTAQTTTGGYIPNSTIANKMDFGANSEFTVQCKVKIPTGSYSYPSFMGKREVFSDGTR